jgi:hypothetical protein
VAIFRATIAGSHAARRESRRPCASVRHPKQRLPVPADAQAAHGGNQPPVLDSQTPWDGCRNTGPDGVALERWSMPRWPTPAPDGRPMFSTPEFVRAAQACVEPTARAESRFRQSERGGHAAAPHFFYSQPILAQPTLHFDFVLLARLESGLLRRNTPLGKPLIEIPGMKFDSPLAVDDSRHPRGGPQFRGKSETCGRPAKPTQDLAFSGAGEFAWTPRGIVSLQSAVASPSIGFHPSGYRTGMNAQKLGDGSLMVACQNMADPQSPPSLQFVLESWSPHAYLYASAKTPVQQIALFN